MHVISDPTQSSNYRKGINMARKTKYEAITSDLTASKAFCEDAQSAKVNGWTREDLAERHHLASEQDVSSLLTYFRNLLADSNVRKGMAREDAKKAAKKTLPDLPKRGGGKAVTNEFADDLNSFLG